MQPNSFSSLIPSSLDNRSVVTASETRQYVENFCFQFVLLFTILKKGKGGQTAAAVPHSELSFDNDFLKEMVDTLTKVNVVWLCVFQLTEAGKRGGGCWVSVSERVCLGLQRQVKLRMIGREGFTYWHLRKGFLEAS